MSQRTKTIDPVCKVNFLEKYESLRDITFTSGKRILKVKNKFKVRYEGTLTFLITHSQFITINHKLC